MQTGAQPAAALDFSGKSVLVTGGSDGIGYGVARAFLAAGASVSITGTREAGAYEQDFSGMNFIRLDVSDAASVAALAGQFTALDVLVNCVGTVLYKGQEFERAGFARVLEINLTGVMDLCAQLQPALAARRGAIINLDSVVAEQAARNNPAYSASKIGLKHLNKVLAIKWGRQGIRVNGIGPGFVPTKLTANQAGNHDAVAARLPLGRIGTPEDIAGVALFLASPLAGYVTGQSLLVDGGLTLLGAL
ncbi:SDR family NAD(P)-dependent oxidoreductase [Ferrovibrio sp.]|uniref:SDR family NAD(P)-dependent oxidoreductase n=1 Tax=Ferrovibrio sp. TaxID=1917215 RepID=UPI001B47AF9F|nr:SDR family oxidoreductase [Ferrovibrio sp.]MBP7065992.1 SDR family oxidoreductase [Ferrovibrio sp.]